MAGLMGYAGKSSYSKVEAGLAPVSDEFLDRLAKAEETFAALRLDRLRGFVELGDAASGSSPRLLYVIRAEGMKRYKIGISVDPERRIRNLQIGSPIRLEVISLRPLRAARLVEMGLHESLAEHRAWGEWFDLPDDVLERLLAAVEAETPAVQAPEPSV
jgi:hypothetical protein